MIYKLFDAMFAVAAMASILSTYSIGSVRAEDNFLIKNMRKFERKVIDLYGEVAVTEDIVKKIKDDKPYIFENMNSYTKFKEGLETVIKLEQFMQFFDRTGGSKQLTESGINKSLSGYYEGQWKLLDSSPGL